LNHTQQTQMKKKAIHWIPYFGEDRDKFSANEHIKKIDKEREENNYTDTETNYLLKLTLRESAANWLEEWTNQHKEETKQWEITRIHFLSEFGNIKQNIEQIKQFKQRNEINTQQRKTSEHEIGEE